MNPGGAAVESAVAVWALADPAAVLAQKAGIEKALRGALGARDTVRHRVSIAAGVICHEDTLGLWATGGEALPSADEARSKAVEIMKKVTTALSPAGAPEVFAQLGQVELMPARARPVDVLQIAGPEGGWDHWLVRSRPQLPLRSGGEAVDVFGALIEVRIGPAGAILGYLSRWRPVSSERVEVELVAPPAPAAGGGAGGEPESSEPAAPSSAEEPKILFVLEGEAVPQFYLAPYYAGEDHEDLTLAAASELSLVVTIVPYSTADPTLYAAVVDGGSGSYGFDWGLLPFAPAEEGGLVELGEGRIVPDRSSEPAGVFSVAKIPPGAHLALVNVVDLKTGGFRHHQEQVFVAVEDGSGDPAEAVA
ncbi:MAG TPA: hypothetical protein VGH14_06850 [Solirubrobacterales bacterium]